MKEEKKFKILIVCLILLVSFIFSVLYTYEESECGYLSGYAWRLNSFPFQGATAEINIDDKEFYDYFIPPINFVNSSVIFDGIELGELKGKQVCLVYERNIYGMRFLKEINPEVI